MNLSPETASSLVIPTLSYGLRGLARATPVDLGSIVDR
jgi:hypothetical protein